MVTTVSTKPVPTTSWWIYLLEGIGAILIGILLLTAPGRTVVAITLFLGWYWLFVGVLELAPDVAVHAGRPTIRGQAEFSLTGGDGRALNRQLS